jgi:Flp pilus assembly protein TadG
LSSERGSVTLWTLGLSLLLVLFGGVAVDFWRALALQRELAAIADSASVAAASGIDEEHYRTTGEVLIDAARATGIGSSYVASQDVALEDVIVTTSPDGLSVSVLVVDHLDLGLIGVFVDQQAPLTVNAEATAIPMLVP